MPYFPAAETARDFDPGYEGPYARHFGGAPGSIGQEAYPADLGKEGAVYRNLLPDRVNEHVRRLYAADVRATDDAIRTLLEDIEPPLDEWTVVFSSDHGEDLGEHGYHYDHGDYVWNPGLHVPLALVMPEGDPLARAERVPDWVSLVDVMPTLAELLGVEIPEDDLVIEVTDDAAKVTALVDFQRLEGEVWTTTWKFQLDSDWERREDGWRLVAIDLLAQEATGD